MCLECEEHNPSETAIAAEEHVEEYANAQLEILAVQADQHGLANDRSLQKMIGWFYKFITRDRLPKQRR